MQEVKENTFDDQETGEKRLSLACITNLDELKAAIDDPKHVLYEYLTRELKKMRQMEAEQAAAAGCGGCAKD